ncbi:MAG TPA: DUF1667 domain-containing protein [Rectinemataceae bacterium]|nr:DUF1667 domain-containing protein [Rectinemataceae bacterium]
MRLTRVIPKARIFELMDVIKRMKVEAPVASGQVLIQSPLGIDCDLIATREVGLALASERTSHDHHPRR